MFPIFFAVYIFSVPGLQCGEYNPLVMERVFTEATDDTTCIDWSFDSKFLAVGSKDMSTRLYSLQKWSNFKSYTFSGHSDAVVGCYFEKDNYDLVSVSRYDKNWVNAYLFKITFCSSLFS